MVFFILYCPWFYHGTNSHEPHGTSIHGPEPQAGKLLGIQSYSSSTCAMLCPLAGSDAAGSEWQPSTVKGPEALFCTVEEEILGSHYELLCV